MAELNTQRLTELRRTRQMSIEELIAQVKGFHERVACVYAAAEVDDLDEEVRLLLDTLIKHERQVIRHLDNYAAKAPAKVLRARIMYVPEVPLDTLHEHISMVADRGRDEIGEAARQMLNVIIRLYDTVAESVAVEEHREALHKLRDFEVKEMIYALRSTEVE